MRINNNIISNDQRIIMNFDEIETNFNDFYSIDSIWIIVRNTGVCLFKETYNKYMNEKISTDLICGALSAISMITEEAFEDEIQFLRFNKRTLFFKHVNNLSCLIAINKQSKATISQIKKIIDKISEEFLIQFRSNFEMEIGNLFQYEKFSNNIPSILKNEFFLTQNEIISSNLKVKRKKLII